MKSIAKYLFRYRGLTPLPFLALMLYYFEGNKYSILVGIVLIILGELIRIWGVSYIGEITRTTIRLRADLLIKDGPYSYVRNPLYIGNIIIFVGFGVLTMALFPYLQIICLFWFIIQYRLIIKIEEDFLKERFEIEYDEYKENVPRFFPKYNRNRKIIRGGRTPDYQNAFRSETRTFQAFFSLGVITLIIYMVK